MLFWTAEALEATGTVERHGVEVSAVQALLRAREAVVELAAGRPTVARSYSPIEPSGARASIARPTGPSRAICSASPRPRFLFGRRQDGLDIRR
jgi:hypothetical protein